MVATSFPFKLPTPISIFATLGLFSYSIYLTHWPAVYVSFLVIRGVFGKGALTPNAPEYLAQLAFMFVFSYGVGWAFFQLVERHFLNTRDAAVAADVPRHASVVSEAGVPKPAQ